MPEVRDLLSRFRAAAAARQWGTGATGSRLVTGSTALQAALERSLAGFLGADAALVFSSGYLANLATVTALVAALGPTLVVSDAGNHALLVDACRLAATAVRPGLTVAPAGAAVVRVVLGDPGLAVAAQRIFADHGLRAGCFRPPSVPHEQSCLRLTARAGLAEADFTAATRALAAVRDHVGTAAPVGRK